MDLKGFVDYFEPMTCIISVEKKPNDSYGAIRLVEGNQAYIDSISLARGNAVLDGDNPNVFVPGSYYTRYIPQDLNFEKTCYRAAVLKQPVHIFTHPERYDFGLSIFMLPLESDSEDIGYCTYTQVLIPIEESVSLSSTISREMAQEILNICIKLRGSTDFKSVMNEIIDDIQSTYKAELACIMLMDENNRTCEVLCEAKNADSPMPPVKDIVNDDFYALAETWKDTLGGSFCLLIQDEKDWEYLKKKNYSWYESLKDGHVNSLVFFPLNSRGHFLGYIWAVNFDKDHSQRLRDSLELITFFIASEIASYKFVEKLRVLSEIDVLTGVLNRNEMNNQIASITSGEEPLSVDAGIVFADMNGLKYVNDHEGHDAGDQMLRNASMILQSAFNGERIYRAGGDEFMILLQHTSVEEMEEKIAEIKAKSQMFDNVRFAAGCCSLKDSSSILDALKDADAKMYADKKQFYKEHPDYART